MTFFHLSLIPREENSMEKERLFLGKHREEKEGVFF
jgi:hypothetical protein